ncbi:TOG array regulator of axonemal microtubules protein 2-like [Passer domesticus]|uniref:TOG array regulator of axonemal microtubules protein 2-like n=1 Tax=Passer domesticus TaxID=48849 RepID=UPI0030FF150F
MEFTGKGKTSEGKGLSGYPLAKRFSLASPSMLLPSKPLPPIQKSSPSTKPSLICSREQENGKDGIGYAEGRRKEEELSSEGQGHKASLLCSSGGDMKKGSLGPPLIPPIGKAPLPPIRISSPSSNNNKMYSMEKENKDIGTGYDNDSRKHQEQSSEEKCYKASLLYSSGGDMKKGLLGPPLIPLIGKAVSPPLGSAVGSLQSSPQLESQESQEMRPRSSSRSKEENSEHAVTSQTATGAQRREEPLRGHGQKDRASPDPQHSLLEALSLLGSDDWEMKEKGLFNIKHLAGSHSEVLLSRLHDICLAVTNEVANLRSKVSYSAIVTLGELFVTLKKNMDSEVDEVARVLLQMVSNSPEFVQKAASQTLGIMVENVTPARAMTALMDMGVKSCHAQVRKCGAELLLSLMERIGVTKLAGTARAERLAHVAGKLAQDCHQDTRHYGQEMVKMLLNHQKFKMLLERSLSTCDLEDILTRMKKKGMENQKAERPSVKELVKKRNDGSKKPQATLSSSKRVKSTSDGCLLHRAQAQVTLPPVEEETELLQKLYNLLEAKGFQTRMEGVSLLQDLCKTSPQLISTNIVQIFEYFVLRISDSHKKVKQKALDVLAEITGVLKDALNPVIIGLVEGITKNLNSKDPRVRAAAVKALEESIAHLDKVSLLKEFSYQWNQLSGQALLDVMECITVLVEWVYARSPEVVQHDALPVLWSFLENKALPVRSANVRTVATKLASALYKVMGTKLKRCAASQPPHVRENLSKMLGW